ncbi:hypothetical protein LA080_015621 [Diaporthe eres]|nr:hypothetical protein LA080_015621 [Diaporthe eres]
MEQPGTPRPCCEQLKLAVVGKARARLLHPLQNSNSNSSSKSEPDSAHGTDPGAGAGQADGEDVMIHAKGGLSGCETTNQNKSWAEVTYAQRNRVGLRSPPGLTRKGSRKFQTTKSIVYPQALPTQFSVLFVEHTGPGLADLGWPDLISPDLIDGLGSPESIHPPPRSKTRGAVIPESTVAGRGGSKDYKFG